MNGTGWCTHPHWHPVRHLTAAITWAIVLGRIVDLGNTLPAYQFCVTEPDGKLVKLGVVRGLIYEGYLLMYDPTSNVAPPTTCHCRRLVSI